MSLRHISRQPHPQDHTPHLNGSSIIPNTPNGSAHPNAMVSPAAAATAVPNGVSSSTLPPILSKLSSANEQTWLLIGTWGGMGHPKADANRLICVFTGRVAEQMGDLEHASNAYENALRHNPISLSGLTQVAGIARIKENYPKVRVGSFFELLQMPLASILGLMPSQSTTNPRISTDRRCFCLAVLDCASEIPYLDCEADDVLFLF